MISKDLSDTKHFFDSLLCTSLNECYELGDYDLENNEMEKDIDDFGESILNEIYEDIPQIFDI